MSEEYKLVTDENQTEAKTEDNANHTDIKNETKQENQTYRESLKSQITEDARKLVLTYNAHYHIYESLKKRFSRIKITQIVLTALSTGGFLSSLIAEVNWPNWIGGFTAALALGLNLYMLNFNISDEMNKHRNSAHSLWSVRARYRSLLVDFDCLADEDIRKKRDELTETVAQIIQNGSDVTGDSYKYVKANLGMYNNEDIDPNKILNI